MPKINWDAIYFFSVYFLVALLVQFRFPTLQFTAKNFSAFSDSNKSLITNSIFVLISFLFCFIKGREIRSTSHKILLTLVALGICLTFTLTNIDVIRQSFGISKMKIPFADWLGIYDFLHCRQEFANIVCDRFGRPWIYGDGFRILSFIKSESVFILVGVISFSLCLYLSMVVLTKFLTLPQLLLVMLSPALLFEADRLNVNIILFVISFILIKSAQNKNDMRYYVFVILNSILNAFKPFFILVFMKKESISKGVFYIFLSLTIVSLSFHGIQNLKIVRDVTQYDLHSQFGSQFIGQLFISSKNLLFLNIVGSLTVIFGTCILLSRAKKDFEKLCTRLISNHEDLAIINNSAILYLVLYFSGSQVIYGSLAGLIFASYLISIKSELSNVTKFLIAIGFCGSLQIGFSTIRIWNSLILAILCLGFLVFNFRNFPNSKLTLISNNK